MKARLIRVVICTVALLPLSVQHVIGCFLGWIAWKFVRRERDSSLVNLRLCFPEKDNLWHENLAKESLKHAGKALVETGALWRWNEKKLCSLVTTVENESILLEALEKNQGVILASPHIGAWELITTHIGSSYPMISLFRPSRLSDMDPIIKNARERFGQRTAPITAAGMRSVLKALSEKQIVGILPDQEPQRASGVFAPFFGVPACTMTLMGKLISKSNIPVVFCVMERLDGKYKLHFVKPESACYDKNPKVSAAAINKTIENCIAIAPEQYLWSYRRFRLKEEGGRRSYKLE